ncbi:WYL domain-containing protein [Apilactobacillus kunkeei]|uniref:WYL domain-containing protein n=1 Tax=Apilactobacillus nanyangensis TaxID=2799579 RepID=A0ABT0HX18_9LACO|nr:WYL domain-containing protein [Apilactobacillus nanyangensis]MCK8611480.1 WYL domain-containing protein [Apilactobacillus nanyangensis]TMT03308.1 WYL domain-containing protein [Apilactobacillus kunkeei]TMT04456.1 WYL domain-containing protein [Apilactobacillus kunkeei]
MQQTERIIKIWLYIYMHRQFTTNELSKHFDVSTRTIFRDLEMLSSLSVPIYAEKGKNGGYRVLDSIKLPPISFSSDEAKAILFSLQMLNKVIETPFSTTSEQIQLKIKDWFEKYDVEEDMGVKFIYPNRGLKVKNIKQIYDYVGKKMLIMVSYKNEERKLVPIGLYAWNGYWYMVGYDINDGTYPNVRVDQITVLNEYPGYKIPTDIMSFNEWYQKGLDDDEWIKIKIIVDEQRKDDITNHWLYNGIYSQYDNGKLMLKASFPKRHTKYVISDILRLGVNAKVISPSSIVENVKSEIKKMNHIYK